MLGTAAPRAISFDVRKLLASRWLWCLATVLFIAGRELSQGFGELLTSLGDTDDATRLYQVRQLLASASWFDMSLPRIGGATPLISHWSRLIDLPLALLLNVFGLFVSDASAELATRIVWPVIVLLIFLRLMVRAADRLHGPIAAALLLCLAITCMTGLFQFRIGRIDHHNAMIMGSISGLLLLVNARCTPRDGILAGIAIGIGLAVGYEPLAFLLPALAGAALLAVIDLAWLTGVRLMATALTATLAVVLLATVAPSLWFAARCDALSLNMVLLAAGGATGLAMIDRRGRSWTVAHRIAALTAAGSAGLVLYGALDPRCLAGPFGQIEPALGPAWLDHVSEGLNVFAFLSLAPLSVVSYISTIALGLWAAVERWRRLRNPEAMALLALLIITAPTGIWMIKLTPYASWIAVFCIALSLADLRPTLQLTALSRQLIGVMAASQFTAAMIASPLLAMAGTSAAALKGDAVIDGTQCMTTPAIRALAPLPKGFIVGSIDFGSYIVALTHHDVLAAPYHRIGQAILMNQAILGAKPADAQKLLAQVHADYVVLCLPKTDTATNSARQMETAAGGIESLLKSGQTISYLTSVAIDSPVPELRVWRVRR